MNFGRNETSASWISQPDPLLPPHFSPFCVSVSVYQPLPLPEGLPVDSEGLPAGSKGLLAGFAALPASSKALPAGSKGLPASSESSICF